MDKTESCFKKRTKEVVNILNRFLKDEVGATAIEYALMASFIAAVIIGAVTLLGGNTQGLFESASVEIRSAGGQ